MKLADSIVGLLFPLEHRARVPISIAKRVPPLIAVNIVLFLFFHMAGIVRILAHPEQYRMFYIAVAATSVVFPLCLVLVRLGRYTLASGLGTFATLLNVLWLGFFVRTTSPNDLYRFSTFVIAAIIANSLVSFTVRQIVVFAFASLASFFLYIFAVMVPLFGADPELRSLGLTVTLLLVAANAIVYSISGLSRDLLGLAEEDRQRNEEKAHRLVALVERAGATLRIGEALDLSTAGGLAVSDAAEEELSALEKVSERLSKDAESLSATDKRILDHSLRLREAVESQNAALKDTGAGISGIVQTIGSLAAIAAERRKAMDALVERIGAQERDARGVLGGIAGIRESSERVLAAVSSIMDLAERTNVLALNAAVEAARAGASGKGFGVIAGEVRKLSSETSASIASISEAMRRNGEETRRTSALVESFVAEIGRTLSAVRDTLDAMTEFAHGLEGMDGGARGLTATTSIMSAASAQTETSVHGTVSLIEGRAKDAEDISRSSAELRRTVDSLRERFAAIETSLREVASIGQRNLADLANLNESISSVDAGR